MNTETVFMTGAGSPTGRAVAHRLSNQYALILSDIDEAAMDATLSDCAHPERHCKICLNLSLPEDASNKFAVWLTEQSCKVTNFVHFAGVFKAGSLRNLSSESVKMMFAVNFFSAAELLRVLISKKYNADVLKSAVFVSTVSALIAVRGYQYYGASRAAVDAFVRSMALELAPRVRVNSLRLGAMENERIDPALLSATASMHPLGLGKGADAASVVDFLLSDGARWITGQNLTVDGGWSCGR